MGNPKKHHFNPVFYLREWCDDTTGQLIEYSRPYRNVIAEPRYPTATGYERFLYTMEGLPDDQKQTIEKNYMARWLTIRRHTRSGYCSAQTLAR